MVDGEWSQQDTAVTRVNGGSKVGYRFMCFALCLFHSRFYLFIFPGLPEGHEGLLDKRLLSLQARLDERQAGAPQRRQLSSGKRGGRRAS